jgi:hypothetical protein
MQVRRQPVKIGFWAGGPQNAAPAGRRATGSHVVLSVTINNVGANRLHERHTLIDAGHSP